MLPRLLIEILRSKVERATLNKVFNKYPHIIGLPTHTHTHTHTHTQ